jgi:anti-sigma B factor antagonist
MGIRTRYAAETDEVGGSARDDVRIVELEGRIAADTITELEDALAAVVAEGTHHIIIDLASVSYISSAGLRVFLSTLKSVKARNGVLILVNLHPNVAKVFKLAGFTKIFTILDDVPSALAAIQP